MERLTIRNSDGTVSQPMDLRWADALERLAAYEDTGMAPEEVSEFASPDVVEIARLLSNMLNERSAQHMVELFEAEKDGRLIALPCKVGSDTYRFFNKKVYGPWQIVKAEIYAEEITLEDDSGNEISPGDIGKTVFLTREDAKAALMKLEGKDDVDD